MRLPFSKLIQRSVVIGFLVSTAIMACMVIAAFLGVFSAVQALVGLSQPDANPLSMLLQAAAPGAFEDKYLGVALVLLSAWVQFGLIASALVAVGLAILSKSRE